jgi:uncharacterized protein involved in outer membrane biogenesis
MKKIIVRLAIALVVLVILAVVGVALFLDAGIKRGVETIGPRLTGTEVKLDSANLSLLSGSGGLKGFVIGNPAGCKTPHAIQVGRASLKVQPSSVFADKVIIRSIDLQAPEITFETDLKGNNLSKILDHMDTATGGTSSTQPAQPNESKASRKLQVDDFLISGGKIHVSLTALGGQSATVPLPEIHLTNLGQGPDGITAAELAKKVLRVIETEAVKASSGAVASLTQQAAGLGKDLTRGLGPTGTNTTDAISRGIGGLFKQK